MLRSKSLGSSASNYTLIFQILRKRAAYSVRTKIWRPNTAVLNHPIDQRDGEYRSKRSLKIHGFRSPVCILLYVKLSVVSVQLVLSLRGKKSTGLDFRCQLHGKLFWCRLIHSTCSDRKWRVHNAPVINNSVKYGFVLFVAFSGNDKLNAYQCRQKIRKIEALWNQMIKHQHNTGTR